MSAAPDSSPQWDRGLTPSGRSFLKPLIPWLSRTFGAIDGVAEAR